MFCLIKPASTAFVFDPPRVMRNYLLHVKSGLHWFAARTAVSRQETSTSVSILSILPFRRKATLDLDQLYRKHAPMVARRVRRFVVESEVEEAVHEVFLKAFEKIDAFRGDSSPTTWLYHIATNHCLNRIRDHKRRQLALQINNDLPWLRPSAEAKSDDLLLLSQLWSRLDEAQSNIAMYYFVDGLTHAEIARITGQSRRTIGNRIDEIKTMMAREVEAKS